MSRDPHAVLQAIPVIRINVGGPPRPLYPRCECGWDLAACHREQNLDGTDEGHVIRMERLEEHALDVECS